MARGGKSASAPRATPRVAPSPRAAYKGPGISKKASGPGIGKTASWAPSNARGPKGPIGPKYRVALKKK